MDELFFVEDNDCPYANNSPKTPCNLSANLETKTERSFGCVVSKELTSPGIPAAKVLDPRKKIPKSNLTPINALRDFVAKDDCTIRICYRIKKVW